MNTYYEHLLELPEDQLCNIGFRVQMMPPAGKRSSEEWANGIARIARLSPDAIRSCVGIEACLSFPDLLHFAIPLPEGGWAIDLEDPEMTDEGILLTLEELENMGLSYEKEGFQYIVQEAKKILHTPAKEIFALERAEDTFQTAYNCINLYGAITPAALARMLNKKQMYHADMLMEEYLHVIIARRVGLSAFLNAEDSLYFVSERVSDPTDFFQTVHTGKLLEYAPLNEEMLSANGDLNVFPRPDDVADVLEILCDAESEEDAEALPAQTLEDEDDPADEAAVSTPADKLVNDPAELMERMVNAVGYAVSGYPDRGYILLEGEQKTPLSREAADAYLKLMKNSPQWRYKGHAVNEWTDTAKDYKARWAHRRQKN